MRVADLITRSVGRLKLAVRQVPAELWNWLERKQAVSSVWNSEKKFRAVFEQAAVGIGRVNFEDARWIDVNDAFCEMLGYTHEEMCATPWPEITHPEDIDLDLIPFRRMAAGELTTYSVEKRFIHKKGHYLWAKLTLSLVHDAWGRPDYEIAVIEDITSRKRLEEDLSRRYEELQKLMDVAPVAIWVSNDPECREIKGNRLANRFYEASPGENISLGHESGQPRRYFKAGRELRADELPMQEAAAQNKEVNAELDVLLPSGKWIAMLGTAVPLRGRRGQVRGCIAAFLDITQRRERDRQLRVQAAALEAAADAIAITDWEGHIQWVNPAFEQLTGYSSEEIVGLTHRFLNSGKQDDEFYKNLWDTVKSGEVWRSELVNRRKDGTLYYEQMSITPVCEKGEIVHFVAIKQDVTKRKEAEEEIARVRRELEDRVVERTAKLRETVAELKQFSYTLTHDMRAPLRAMSGFAQILLEELSPQLSGMQRGYLQTIINSATRLDSLIRDALNYEKLVSQEMKLAPVDIEGLLREMVDTYSEFSPEVIDIHLEPPIEAVLGNRAGLTQCFSHLIKNAVKYAKPNLKPKLTIRSERRDACVRIWFEDNGIGIAPEYQGRVFEMFTQLHEGYDGTGVGLALVRKAAERMEGSVGVESEEGRGSRFWIDLKSADVSRVDDVETVEAQ